MRTSTTKRVRPPMQPIVMVDGVARFQENQVIALLRKQLEQRGVDLNAIEILIQDKTPRIPASDAEQFHQLIGWSVSGISAIPGYRSKTVERGDAKLDVLMGRAPKPNEQKDRTKDIIAWLRRLPPAWREDVGLNAVAEIADQLESGEWESPDGAEETGGAGGIPPAPDSTVIPHPTDPPGTGHDSAQEDE